MKNNKNRSKEGFHKSQGAIKSKISKSSLLNAKNAYENSFSKRVGTWKKHMAIGIIEKLKLTGIDLSRKSKKLGIGGEPTNNTEEKKKEQEKNIPKITFTSTSPAKIDESKSKTRKKSKNISEIS